MLKMKKGFTLIEMLAVIAIIAILVSIVTPAYLSYTTKANAATNAANMRSVKATVATMLVSGEIDPESGYNADRVSNSLKSKIDSVDDSNFMGRILKYVLSGLEPIVSTVLSESTTFYAEDGVFTIDGHKIAAPKAKRLDVDGIVLRAGTEMTLSFAKNPGTGDYNDIIVTYDGIPIDVFAIVAADGDEANIDEIEHNFVDTNTDWVCDICGKPLVDGWDTTHGESEIVGGLGNGHLCSDGNHDHLCDDPDCKQWVAAHYDSPSDGDHICDASSVCRNTSKIEDCTDGNDANHKCDICNAEGITDHSYDSNGNCACGATQPSTEPTTEPTEPSGGGGSCVTPDTLITLADGSKKRMAEITNSDYLMVWDFFNGQYAAVPASVLVFHGNNYYDVCTLIFEDGTKVETIGGHDFFDFNLNEFVTIDEFNASSYVGHSFAKASGNSYKAVKLVDYIVETEYTGSYSLISALHNNFIVEDMISLTPLTLIDTDNFFEYFEVGAGMKYDEAKMQADIETYGLYTYEDFADYLTYEQYVALNAPYYKVLVGKGYVTFADLLTAISAYVN